MTDHKGLPVKGYMAQSAEKVELVNRFKEMEERLLREIDYMMTSRVGQTVMDPAGEARYDTRWLAIARTGFEQAFMALNRSVFQPQRIRLPEDEAGRQGE